MYYEVVGNNARKAISYHCRPPGLDYIYPPAAPASSPRELGIGLGLGLEPP
jgi:hypothetical protein